MYTYLHQLFAMFSGRLQHLPEKNKKLMQVSHKQAFYLEKHTVFDIYKQEKIFWKHRVCKIFVFFTD
jgi:hypothetical protein